MPLPHKLANKQVSQPSPDCIVDKHRGRNLDKFLSLVNHHASNNASKSPRKSAIPGTLAVLGFASESLALLVARSSLSTHEALESGEQQREAEQHEAEARDQEQEGDAEHD